MENRMYMILMSGGSGRRLWPLTDAQHPKQYLKLIPSPDGQMRSMAQRVWSQLKESGLAPRAVVCAGRDQRHFLAEQLPEADIAEEPSQRDTFPAVALACAYLIEKKGARLDDPVVVIPIDAYVDDAYFSALKCLPHALKASGADVMLMGKRPTAEWSDYAYILPECHDDGAERGGGNCGEFSQPEMMTKAVQSSGENPQEPDEPPEEALEKYGYILPDCRASGYIRVGGFLEKPDREAAQALIQEGALWNMGIFCMRVGLLREKLTPYGLPLEYQALYERYPELPAISFDHEVLEHSKNLAAVVFEGEWRDLGTWNELMRVLPPQENVIRHENCSDTFILNQMDIPVVAVGTNGLIIVATENGILVTDGPGASLVKEIAPEGGRHG
jgi:mannose-1-phosphate guanylyltransferase